MSSYNPSSQTAIISVDSQKRLNLSTDLNMSTTTQKRCSSNGPVAILWDIENCPVPSDVRPEDVASNIRMAVQLHPVINGAVVIFSAFGDFNAFPRRVREGCQRTGVKLVDVPNGRKDAADKAILLDMFLFILDNPPPATIILISGDVDFAPALHVLGQRGFTVIVVIPSGVFVNSALTSAGKFVWDWQSIVHGEGFVPLPKLPRVGQYLMGCDINDTSNLDGMNDDETILFGGIPQSCYNNNNSRESSLMVSQFQNEYSSSSLMSCWPSNSGESAACCPPGHLESTMWVAPGDLNGLKGQLVKLLELSGGCIPLMRVPSEYQKNFCKPLFVADYGAPKLVDLFKKMGDVVAVDGKGNKRFVYLRNSKPSLVSPSPSPSPSPPVVLLRRENKGKNTKEEITIIGGVSSDELSDTGSVQSEKYMEEFKLELQDIMVSYCCKVRLDYFEEIYKQRYSKPLDYKKLGIEQLEQLFDKVSDVVAICEDPSTGTKLVYVV